MSSIKKKPATVPQTATEAPAKQALPPKRGLASIFSKKLTVAFTAVDDLKDEIQGMAEFDGMMAEVKSLKKQLEESQEENVQSTRTLEEKVESLGNDKEVLFKNFEQKVASYNAQSVAAKALENEIEKIKDNKAKTAEEIGKLRERNRVLEQDCNIQTRRIKDAENRRTTELQAQAVITAELEMAKVQLHQLKASIADNQLADLNIGQL